MRFRGEVARKDFDAAIVTAKTMFALARHLGECPTTEANRIGLSVAGLALDTLEELVQQSGSPNLYWALTDLPTPLVDLRRGLQGERAMISKDLEAFREDASLSDQELDELIGRLSGRAGFARQQAGLPPRDVRAALTTQVKDAARVDAARKRLIEAGIKAELVEKFPALQVILLDEKKDFEIRRDEEMKLLGLAPWEIEAQLGRGKPPRRSLFADLLPRVAELRLEQAAVERRIVILRHIEALRLHASRHEGRLPEKLQDVGVPLPDDPFTGKPFGYSLKGSTARLETPTLNRERMLPAMTSAFESHDPEVVPTEQASYGTQYARDSPATGQDRTRRCVGAVAALRGRPVEPQVGRPPLPPRGFGASREELAGSREARPRRARSTLLLRGEPDAADILPTLIDVGRVAAARDDGTGAELRGWWLYCMLHGGHPLREKLTLFWHNHFATSIAKVRDAA